MAIWIVNGSEKKRLIQCKREDVSNYTYSHAIDESKYRLSYAISSIFSNDLHYCSSSFKDDASEEDITCGKYDFFECKEVELKFSPEEYTKLAMTNSFDEYYNKLNYISNAIDKQLLCIYTENSYGAYLSFYNEHTLKRKHRIFGIIKDSVKFIPNKNGNKPTVTRNANYRIFKEFVGSTVLNDLKTLNIIKDSDQYDFKFINENIIELFIGGNIVWRHEIQKVILECLPIIKEKLFEGKFKEICDKYNITDISLLNNIVGETRDLEFDVSALGKEEENES